jgi:tetratricopeptide (TPR) repeat protein
MASSKSIAMQKSDHILLRSDYPAAETAIAEAVRRAPSVPRAYADWGDILVAKNDVEGALAKYADAHERGPRFADPLKSWGDVLAKQGHIKEALVKYDEALKYAPNWKQLKEARERIVQRKT